MRHPSLEGVVKTAASEVQFAKVWAPRGWEPIPDEEPAAAVGPPASAAPRATPAPPTAPVDDKGKPA